MKRRNFIKSSAILSGVAVMSPSWVTNNKVRFGYYYPTDATPKAFINLIAMFKSVGIDAQLENLFEQDLNDVILKTQRGYYAGLFASTNLMAEQIPMLYLIADGPDLVNSQKYQDWCFENKTLFDKCLKKQNLVRLPFVSLGARRGFWYNKNLKNFELKNKVTYSDGLWKDLFKSNGASFADKSSRIENIDIILPSNLISVENSQINKDFGFASISAQLNTDLVQPQFDLYLSDDFWSTLSKKHQRSMSEYLGLLSQSVQSIINDNEQRIYSSIETKTDQFENQIKQIADINLSRKLRLSLLEKIELTSDEINLIQSYLNISEPLQKSMQQIKMS